jgi:hypothetical protein
MNLVVRLDISTINIFFLTQCRYKLIKGLKRTKHSVINDRMVNKSEFIKRVAGPVMQALEIYPCDTTEIM